MKFILIVFLNATAMQVPSGNIAPAVTLTTASFETEEACTAAIQKIVDMIRRTQFTNSFNAQAQCVPAGENKPG